MVEWLAVFDLVSYVGLFYVCVGVCTHLCLRMYVFMQVCMCVYLLLISHLH